MDDISNRTLAIFLITAIIVSLGATVSVLNKMSPGTAGKAYSDQGDVSLTVSSTVSIILLNDTINFGSGYVNDSCKANVNNATLVAGQVYSDTNNSDCWTGTQYPTSLHIENDGNNNVLLKVLGPTNASFFSQGASPYPGSNPYSLLFRAWNYEANSCDANGALQATWTDFGGTNRTVCSNFTYAPTRDNMAIDIQVVIPRDLAAGTYQNSTITFMAATS